MKNLVLIISLILSGCMLTSLEYPDADIELRNPENSIDKMEFHNINGHCYGDGVGILLGDLGRIDVLHQEFHGQNVTSLEARSPEHHGMVDATILVGNGLKPRVGGVAPNAHLVKVHQYKAYFEIEDLVRDYPDIRVAVMPFLWHSQIAGEYNYHSHQVDVAAYSTPGVLHVWPSGGQWAAVHDAGVAKNVLTVGQSTWDFENNLVIFKSGGFGVLDGRYKPEIMGLSRHKGARAGSTSGYKWLAGTSQASVVVAGGAALITEMWIDYYQEEPQSALIKNILCNGADMMGSAAEPYPRRFDAKWGFGNMNVERSQSIIRNSDVAELEINAGEAAKIRLSDFCITSGIWKVMISWMDEPVLVDDPADLLQSDIHYYKNGEEVLPRSNIMSVTHVGVDDELEIYMNPLSPSGSEVVYVTWVAMTDDELIE